MATPAATLASQAAGDMAQIVAINNQILQEAQKIAALRAQAKEKAEAAKAKLAAAAQIVSGGTGKGQELQVRAGQSTIKLEYLQGMAAKVAESARDISAHAHAVESDIRTWAAGLTR